MDGAEMSGGSFRAGAGGIYQVMVNMEMITASDEQHWVWVMINGVKMEESKIHSSYSTYSTGKGADAASRELLLNLNTGDTINLQHDTDGNNGHVSVTMCVSSIEFQ